MFGGALFIYENSFSLRSVRVKNILVKYHFFAVKYKFTRWINIIRPFIKKKDHLIIIVKRILFKSCKCIREKKCFLISMHSKIQMNILFKLFYLFWKILFLFMHLLNFAYYQTSTYTQGIEQ